MTYKFVMYKAFAIFYISGVDLNQKTIYAFFLYSFKVFIIPARVLPVMHAEHNYPASPICADTQQTSYNDVYTQAQTSDSPKCGRFFP